MMGRHTARVRPAAVFTGADKLITIEPPISGIPSKDALVSQLGAHDAHVLSVASSPPF
jgi:hypothetical protein